MPRNKNSVYRTVAVPLEVYEQLRELSKADDRTIARELAYLIKEAYAQIIGGRG